MRSIRLTFFIVFISLIGISNGVDRFLAFSKTELCDAEPHLKMCQTAARARSSKILDGKGLTADRLEHLSQHSKDGFIEEDGNTETSLKESDPFEELSTRSPINDQDTISTPTRHLKSHHRHRSRKYKNPYAYYQQQNVARNSALYRVYPGLRPKDQRYCGDMKPMFAYTCQPSKPLRLDLVEFCKDYSAFCQVPNFHRLPGPRMGPPLTDKGVGHVDINGHFGFGVGALPGFEVGVGWGVDVGPIPGMGESVGVGVGLDLGIMGAKSPEGFRRGQDDPNAKGGGIVGINGGVGVKAPGAGNVGVGSGIGVGK
ncbi:unnamed protein product [Caenorhabditis angaria]|uniref:Uncharacterized protein n=1 Tax=Caenorhabditis angaria TaxID=860376 RepID=A0A9P1IC66_9PELO|nr:unnamed protein product [Caenorhabditis angaria]